MKFEIKRLAEVPEYISDLAALFIAEWEPYYGADGPGDAESDLRACAGPGTLPTAFVAINSEGEAIGTGALKRDSLGSLPDECPWIAALVVAPQHRRNGVATALISALTQEARQQGFDCLYVSTDTEPHLLKNQGWKALRESQSLRGPVTTFRLDL